MFRKRLKPGAVACIVFVAMLPFFLLPPGLQAGSTAPAAGEAGEEVLDPQRKELAAYLETRGASREDAIEAVSTLSAEEVALVLENREMIKPGGDLSDTELILIVLVAVLLFAVVILIISPSISISAG